MKKSKIVDNIKKPILDLAKKIIIDRATCWGVELESKLPVEFIITNHAYDRMKERFRCSEDKIKKVVMKAWTLNRVPSKEFIVLKEMIGHKTKGHTATKYKMFNGYVFVFTTHGDKYNRFEIKKLITVYKKKKKSDLLKLKYFNGNRTKRKYF